MISITLEGKESVFAKFKDIDQKLAPKALRLLADALHEDVYRAADKHTRTGAMARSVFLRKIENGYEIGHDLQHAKHALFVHWGTKPHVIRPKNKKVLRWATANQARFAKGIARGSKYLGKKYGQIFGFFFAKEVHHPGYQGDPYLVEAIRNAEARHWPGILNQLKV